MSDPATNETTGVQSPWAALRAQPDVLRAARDDLRTGRRVGTAVTLVWVAYAFLALSAGATFLGVFAVVVAGLFAYGTGTAAESPREARVALMIGIVLGIPFGLTMLFLVKRIKEYEAALARAGRR